MRRIRNLILLAVLMVMLACPAFAVEGTTIFFPLTVVQVKEETNPYSPYGSKVYTYYSSDGRMLWQVTIQGQFRRSPTGVRCVDAKCEVEVFDDRWYIVSTDTSCYGHHAAGEVVMGRNFLGIPVDRETVRMSLSSDWYGEIR